MKRGLLAGFIGLILVLFSFISIALFSNVFWYGTFVFGLTLFLGFINYSKNRKSLFTYWERNKKDIIKIYFAYFFLGLLIEIIGRFYFNFWFAHEKLTPAIQIFEVFILAYPFAFFSIYELYILLKSSFSSSISFFLTFIISVFLHEIPNTFVWEWVYTIPYFTFEIFNINIAVIFGWIILIIIPLSVEKYLSH